jgi:hypothetical protein
MLVSYTSRRPPVKNQATWRRERVVLRQQNFLDQTPLFSKAKSG